MLTCVLSMSVAPSSRSVKQGERIRGLGGAYLDGLALCLQVMWDLAMEILGKGDPVPYAKCYRASTGRAPEPSDPAASRALAAELLAREGYSASDDDTLLAAVDAWRRDRKVPALYGCRGLVDIVSIEHELSGGNRV
jgi:hypothetical protein